MLRSEFSTHQCWLQGAVHSWPIRTPSHLTAAGLERSTGCPEARKHEHAQRHRVGQGPAAGVRAPPGSAAIAFTPGGSALRKAM